MQGSGGVKGTGLRESKEMIDRHRQKMSTGTALRKREDDAEGTIPSSMSNKKFQKSTATCSHITKFKHYSYNYIARNTPIMTAPALLQISITTDFDHTQAQTETHCRRQHGRTLGCWDSIMERGG